MNILKRATSGGEVIPSNVSEADLKDDMNRRAARAGYCTRDGNPTGRTKIQNRGYGESNLNVWLRDENGNLIGD